MIRHKWLILALVMLLGTGLSFTSGGGQDQPDFPLIYIDAGCAGTHVGSEANPYDDLADINWTTGGDNSIFDYLAGVPAQSPTIYLMEDDTWREQMTIGCSGTATYPIVITAYGSGADPIISGGSLITTWTERTTVFYPAANADDAYVNVGGTSITDDNELIMGENGYVANTGIRFTGVTIDKDESVATAIVRVTSSTARGGEGCMIDVYGEDNASPAAFSTYANFAGRSLTTAKVDWAIAGDGWNDGDINDTPDITTVVNEITALVGWANGNNLVIFLKDDSSAAWLRRQMSSFNFDSGSEKPELRITYSGSNIWQATVTTEPSHVKFDNVLGQKKTTVAACTSVRDWHWVANVLYIYHTQDPDGDIVIEAEERAACIAVSNRNYITIQNLTLEMADSAVTTWTCSNLTISNCTMRYCEDNGVSIHAASGGSYLIDSNAFYDNNRSAVWVTDHDSGSGTESTISNNTIYNCLESGIYLWGNYWIVENNTIYDCGVITTLHMGIHIWDDGGGDKGQNNIIRYNHIYDILGHDEDGTGIGLDIKTTANQVYYNLVHGCEGPGIYIHSGTSNLIYNNVCYDNCQDTTGDLDWAGEIRISTDAVNATADNLIRNNIGYSTQGNPAIFVGNQAENDNNTINYNCWYGDFGDWWEWGTGTTGATIAGWRTASSQGANDMATDPIMTDPANDDFTLLMASPCIDKGTDVGLMEDYQGLKIRHASDIGAHENQTNAIFMPICRLMGFRMPWLETLRR